jgi:uncharacterized membrane protein
MTLNQSARRRASFVYLLQMAGSFMFIFVVVAVLLQLRWRWITKSSPILQSHFRWQLISVVFFIVGAVLALTVPYPVAQLCIGYGSMIGLLGSAAFGSYKLRRELAAPYNFFSRTGE